jgi:hypothetical protein
MASRTAKRNDTATVCTSRRVKSSDKRTEKPLEKGNSGCEGASSEPHHQIEEHKEEEAKSKNEKESTSLPNSDLNPHLASLKPRRITRSLISTSKRIPEAEAHPDPITPEDNSPLKPHE